MDHREAIETMASERYLLGELSPEQRESYEEHLFECVECASDAMLGAAFVDRAKAVLPTVTTANVSSDRVTRTKAETVKRDWFAWLRPAIMVPVFASLVGVIAYQNLVTYPALQLAASEPQVLPAATVLHGDTRSAVPVVHADVVRGSAIEVEVPEGGSYASYQFEFFNSAGKLVFSQTAPAAVPAQDMQTIYLPGHVRQDTYKLVLSGVSASGEHTNLHQQFFELQVDGQAKK